MTDHSILSAGAPDLPFQGPARTITGLFDFVFVTAPKALKRAVLAHNLVVALDGLDDAQLAALGVSRENLAAYVAEKTGVLPKKAGN